MPQISKGIPIKGHKSYPAVLRAREYYTYLNSVYVAQQSLALATAVTDEFYFYHATQPYELSFEIICTGTYRVRFEQSDAVVGTPISNAVLCTNRHNLGTFGVVFGDVTSWSTNIKNFVDIYLSADYLYSFGRRGVTFVCAPDKYYILEVTNTDSGTEKQNIMFYIGDFQGAN
jgi:hypothetical protein